MTHFTPNTPQIGIIPMFFDSQDPRPAREQLHTAYQHGGGVQPIQGFTYVEGDLGMARLEFAGDPPMQELSRATLHEELIIVFEGAWLAIVQPDKTYIVTRVD